MRTRLLAVVFLCIVGLSPAAAGGPARHSESQSYVVPTGITTSHEDSYPTGPAKELAARLEFTPEPSDRYVSFKVADLTGRSVILEIHQNAAPGAEPLEGYMCQSAMPTAYKLISDETIVVRVLHGLCGNHNWGWATQGTVTATFSNANPGHVASKTRHRH